MNSGGGSSGSDGGGDSAGAEEATAAAGTPAAAAAGGGSAKNRSATSTTTSKTAPASSSTWTYEFEVEGMTCTNCSRSVANAVRNLGMVGDVGDVDVEGGANANAGKIASVSVSLATDTATVELVRSSDSSSDSASASLPALSADDVREAIEDAGYAVTGVRRVAANNVASSTSTSAAAAAPPAAAGTGGDERQQEHEQEPMPTPVPDDDDNDPSAAWERLRERQSRKVSGRRSAFLLSLLGTLPILLITMVLPRAWPSLLEPLRKNSVRIAFFGGRDVSYETLLLWFLATPVQFLSGWEFYRGACRSLCGPGGTAGMDVLVALGTTASLLYALYGSVWKGDANTAHFFETSATLVGFVLCGKWMQASSVRRTSQALSKLMKLQAKTAIRVVPIPATGTEEGNQKTAGGDPNTSNSDGGGASRPLESFDPLYDAYGEETVPAGEIRTGDVVKVLRGASVPADGTVMFGEVSVDESMITGESVPVLKSPGSTVLGGTVCVEASSFDGAGRAPRGGGAGAGAGAAFVRVTGVGSSTALARIVQLVQDAQAQSAPIQSFADRVAAVFVPAVCAVSLFTFTAWYVLCRTGVVPARWYGDFEEDPFTFSIIFGIACLVISCPCALGLATPTAVMVGTGVGASNGILMKGGEALEISSTVNTVVFDKTGTLTQGTPAVMEFVELLGDHDALNTNVTLPDGVSAHDYLLWLFASLERTSEHPLARAVVTYAETKLGRAFLDSRPFAQPVLFKALTGRGASATIDGRAVAAGNRAFAEVMGINVGSEAEASMTRIENEGKTAILASVDGAVCVVMGIADAIKPEAASSIAFLRESLHVDVWMVTGDNKRTATAISRQLKLPANRVVAEAMPAAKVEQVRTLQDNGNVVCFVGDGINDSPALAQANIGMSIGTGAEIAAEASDMVLVKGKVTDVCAALHLSRVIFRRIQLNLMWSLLYNCFGIPLAAGAFFPLLHSRLPPTVAAIAMALSSVSVVMSSLSLRLYKVPVIYDESSALRDHGGGIWAAILGRRRPEMDNELSLEESLLENDQLAVV